MILVGTLQSQLILDAFASFKQPSCILCVPSSLIYQLFCNIGSKYLNLETYGMASPIFTSNSFSSYFLLKLLCIYFVLLLFKRKPLDSKVCLQNSSLELTSSLDFSNKTIQYAKSMQLGIIIFISWVSTSMTR